MIFAKSRDQDPADFQICLLQTGLLSKSRDRDPASSGFAPPGGLWGLIHFGISLLAANPAAGASSRVGGYPPCDEAPGGGIGRAPPPHGPGSGTLWFSGKSLQEPPLMIIARQPGIRDPLSWPLPLPPRRVPSALSAAALGR